MRAVAKQQADITVYLMESGSVGRVVVEKVRRDGAKGLKDDVPVGMLRVLAEHWNEMGWTIVDQRGDDSDQSSGAEH